MLARFLAISSKGKILPGWPAVQRLSDAVPIIVMFRTSGLVPTLSLPLFPHSHTPPFRAHEQTGPLCVSHMHMSKMDALACILCTCSGCACVGVAVPQQCALRARLEASLKSKVRRWLVRKVEGTLTRLEAGVL